MGLPTIAKQTRFAISFGTHLISPVENQKVLINDGKISSQPQFNCPIIGATVEINHKGELKIVLVQTANKASLAYVISTN